MDSIFFVISCLVRSSYYPRISINEPRRPGTAPLSKIKFSSGITCATSRFLTVTRSPPPRPPPPPPTGPPPPPPPRHTHTEGHAPARASASADGARLALTVLLTVRAAPTVKSVPLYN